MSKPIVCRGVRLASALATAVALLAASPLSAGVLPRVRGIVTNVGMTSITVKLREGGSVTLQTGNATKYASVVSSSLAAIKVNDFVGTAVKGPPRSMVAVELVIIPESLRAGRINYYRWDPLPDPSSPRASTMTATSMTNGLVSNVSAAASRSTKTNATNGVVSSTLDDARGVILTVTYDGGRRKFRIAVPSRAPITRYELANRSIVAIGSSVFVKVTPGNLADLVTVGKGITPPQ